MTEVAEKACVYASLILADEQISVTADKLAALIAAADLEVESIWPKIFAKALEGKNVQDMILNVGSASAAPVVGGGAVAGGAAGGSGAAAEEKKEEAKKEEEESDDDMGFGLFD